MRQPSQPTSEPTEPSPTTATPTTTPESKRGRSFARVNEVVMPTLNVGLGNPPPVGLGAVAVETIGRVSGKPRVVPLLSRRCGDWLVVSTLRPTSQWFANLEANPTACGLL